MLTKLLILLVIHDFMETAVVFRRVCSYCRDKEVYQLGRNYVGFYQKENTGPLEGYPCARDPGNLAQIIRKDTGETFTYRDCGTYLLQEFGQEKINLSYTQYAMILTDTDEIGNTWVFKFCNKEKCLHPSDYNIDCVEDEKGNAGPDVEAIEKACTDNGREKKRRIDLERSPLQSKFDRAADLLVRDESLPLQTRAILAYLIGGRKQLDELHTKNSELTNKAKIPLEEIQSLCSESARHKMFNLTISQLAV